MHIIYIFSGHSKIWIMHRGLALGKRCVNKVSNRWLWGSLLYENILLVLLLTRRHERYQLVIYMHEMMMQHLVIRQQQLLN